VYIYRVFRMCRETTESPKTPILSPPKAEVTGSNPVGCANDFKDLGGIFASQKVPCPESVRRICSLEVPRCGVQRIENACRMLIRLFSPFVNRHNIHYRDRAVLPDANQ
jgi:hypothetical protein